MPLDDSKAPTMTAAEIDALSKKLGDLLSMDKDGTLHVNATEALDIVGWPRTEQHLDAMVDIIINAAKQVYGADLPCTISEDL